MILRGVPKRYSALATRFLFRGRRRTDGAALLFVTVTGLPCALERRNVAS
jgi:hypothetical protein